MSNDNAYRPRFEPGSIKQEATLKALKIATQQHPDEFNEEELREIVALMDQIGGKQLLEDYIAAIRSNTPKPTLEESEQIWAKFDAYVEEVREREQTPLRIRPPASQELASGDLVEADHPQESEKPDQTD